jgi:hypothetical protein
MATWLQQQAGKVGSYLDNLNASVYNPFVKNNQIRLPDLQISEILNNYATSVNPFNPPPASAKEPIDYSQFYSQNQNLRDPFQNPYNPQRPAGGGGGGAGNVFNNASNNINSQQNSGLDLIEQDYNNAMSAFAGQENVLRGQADISGRQIESEAGGVRTQLGQAQGTAEQGIQTQQQTAEKEGTNQMQQARDLFRQTQQQNIAQLSALGISSSSVSEALAERLGVETARRIAGVTGSLAEVRTNAANELKRTKDYYQQKLTGLAEQVQIQKSQIQNSLLQGLNQINAARNQAASDKARGRNELISNAQNALAGIEQKKLEFETSLKQWAEQKNSALTPLITDPNFVNSLTQATNTFNQRFAPSGFQYVPEVSTNAAGNVSGQINYNLQKKNQDEDLAAKYGL